MVLHASRTYLQPLFILLVQTWAIDLVDYDYDHLKCQSKSRLGLAFRDQYSAVPHFPSFKLSNSFLNPLQG